MSSMKLSLVAGLALTGGSAVAADAAFENHLTSTTMVSPAQIYQIENLRTDFAVGYLSGDATAKSKATGGGKTDASATGTNVFAGAIYGMSNLGLRAGATVNYTSTDLEVKDVTKGDMSMTTFTPQAAYSAGPVVVGLAIDVNQRAEKFDDESTGTTVEGKEQKATYTQFRPGVLFASNNVEAGVTYETRRKSNPEKEDELAVSEPAMTTLHGRYAMGGNMAFGGIVQSLNYQGLDKDAYKAQSRVVGTAEMGFGAVKVEGDLGYNTAYYKNKDTMGMGNIGTVELGAAADYAVSKAAKVGGALAYEFGSDKNDAAEYTTNTLGVLVRGDMKF